MPHRSNMLYSDCGMLHRPALRHAALGGVGLMSQIGYIVNIGWDIFHPILFNHSNMLHSDCSRLIGRPHCYAFHRTIHQGVGRINQIWRVVHDGEENSFLKMNLRVWQKRRTKRSASDLLCNLQGIDCNRQPIIRLFASQSDLWRTEHYHASCTASQIS